MPVKDVVIVGGGISGLSALHYIRTLKPNYSVTLYEAESRLGGTIGTDHIDGFSYDWGPNGFLDREPLTLQLCKELGLTNQLERANANVSNRFILRGNKLRAVPMTPLAFLKSDILSWPGKLRILKEPFAAKAPVGVDESIYDFGHRRIGREAADYLIQPMVSGIYGGVAGRMSLASCFPTMREMEVEYGSLFKAMIAKAKKAKVEGKKSGGPAGPGGWLTSFYGGLEQIIKRFHELYDSHIVTGNGVNSITRQYGNFLVQLANGESIETRQVIVATPSYQAASIIRPAGAALAEALASIPYAPIAVVCLGFPAGAVRHSLNGFGFLVPSRENRRILGSIWTSSIFKDRAPQGSVQLRCMVGGDGDHDSANLAEEELIRTVLKDLDDILGIDGDPQSLKIYRWTHGIPQYRVGHGAILKKIESQLGTIRGLHLAGNAYYGIGLNDCVKQAYKIALNT